VELRVFLELLLRHAAAAAAAASGLHQGMWQMVGICPCAM
jgi:hypothetical protein